MDDPELLDFPAEILDVVITKKPSPERPSKRSPSPATLAKGRGVVLRKLVRRGHEMPFTLGTTIDRGDVLQIGGAKRDVERAVQALGYADRPTNMTDMVFVGLGIVLGGSSARSPSRWGASP